MNESLQRYERWRAQADLDPAVAAELAAMGEDEDIQFVDEDDVEDLDDFEYEEDWDEEESRQ